MSLLRISVGEIGVVVPVLKAGAIKTRGKKSWLYLSLIKFQYVSNALYGPDGPFDTSRLLYCINPSDPHTIPDKFALGALLHNEYNFTVLSAAIPAVTAVAGPADSVAA
jgi:hypothetical protein